jgi:hypothetical protein
MITTKTVLVLGAGASKPYGFPTGADLVNGITAIEAEDRDTVERAGAKLDQVQRFQWALQNAQSSSIDEFLELCPAFLDVGKLVLASIFLRAEHKSLSEDKFNLRKSDHWYKILKARRKSAFEAIGHNKLRIMAHPVLAYF